MFFSLLYKSIHFLTLEQFDPPICLWDEGLSTYEAKLTLRDVGVTTHKAKRAGLEDSTAASIILQVGCAVFACIPSTVFPVHTSFSTRHTLRCLAIAHFFWLTHSL